ncbi:MAG: hypothetical protein Q8S44_01630 [Flavobacteriaceae bacterium]|nr:hypothetical protein [Flavobacteriaceae bacterium]
MIIRYKKNYFRSKLILGIGFPVLGLAAFLLDDNPSIFFYGYFFIGFLSLGTFLFEWKKQYLKIESGVLTKNSLFPKKINLSDIIQIKKFAGDLTLFTATDKLVINIDWVDKDSFKELELLLQNSALKKQV